MSKNLKKTDADKKGKARMAKFERKQESKVLDDDEYIVTAYQKIEPGEWEKVEIRYKRK